MPVNYSISVRTLRLQDIINSIDAGATNGWLRLLDFGGAVLSSFQLSRPMGTITGAVLTFSGLSLIDPAAAAAGSATQARVEDGNGTTVISGLTVGTGNASDIVMSPTNAISAGQTVAVTQASITGN